MSRGPTGDIAALLHGREQRANRLSPPARLAARAKLPADRLATLYGTHSAPSPGGGTSGARPGGTAARGSCSRAPTVGAYVLLFSFFLGGFVSWHCPGCIPCGR